MYTTYTSLDPVYSKMLMRRRFCKRVLFMVAAFGISFYISILLFGDFKIPRVMHLTDLGRCPACYGVSVCPELYSDQVLVETSRWQDMFFNAKNIYYGYTKSNRKVVLKKLAHDSEFRDFDSKLCKSWELKRNCKPTDLLNATNIEKKIEKLVHYNFTHPELLPRKGLVMCPYSYSIFDFLKPVMNKLKTNKHYKSDMINIWTMLSINPEPIIFQVIPKTQGWPIPAYGGVCGRLELLSHEGEPLSSLTYVAWHRKLHFASKILEAALDFTFKHERYRFYLMDWSMDNIVVNAKDGVSFVDLEDIIVLDKQISPRKDLPNWYKRYTRENSSPDYSFSIPDLCKHHLSDYNIWAACYVLAGKDSSFLLPIPDEYRSQKETLTLYLNQCLNGNDRFKAVLTLQKYIDGLIREESVSGYGVHKAL